MTKRLMLIEDDEDDLLCFSDAIGYMNVPVQVEHYTNGLAALERLAGMRGEWPDIIFLDVNMPAMTGWECLREIKKMAGARNVPIIMYSSADLSHQGIQPRDVGAEAFYQKSDSFEELKRTLKGILEEHLFNGK
ncbi:MAG: response regulator [Bacteroidetes bacterium]|nr:response regulator [Bacteroidota bacterium]